MQMIVMSIYFFWDHFHPPPPPPKKNLRKMYAWLWTYMQNNLD